MDFVAARGRLPEGEEIDAGLFQSVFGSVRRPFALVERVTGGEGWQQIRDEWSQDLLVGLALAQFGKRPRSSASPPALQYDVKAFCGTYSRAWERADELLFSAGKTVAVNAACAAASWQAHARRALCAYGGHRPPASHEDRLRYSGSAFGKEAG